MPGNPGGGAKPGGNPGGAAAAGESDNVAVVEDAWEGLGDVIGDWEEDIPPLPKPGAPGKWGKPGGAPPPTPAAGPCHNTSQQESIDMILEDRSQLTAREVGGAPRPAGLATPGPALRDEAMPPVEGFPSLALGSLGGGDSTETEMMLEPRRMTRPSIRFSSVSTVCVLCFLLMRRNSSVSLMTRFMCFEEVSNWARGTGSWGLMARAYLVKREHLADKGPAIVHHDAHTVVDLFGANVLASASGGGYISRRAPRSSLACSIARREWGWEQRT